MNTATNKLTGQQETFLGYIDQLTLDEMQQGLEKRLIAGGFAKSPDFSQFKTVGTDSFLTLDSLSLVTKN